METHHNHIFFDAVLLPISLVIVAFPHPTSKNVFIVVSRRGITTDPRESELGTILNFKPEIAAVSIIWNYEN